MKRILRVAAPLVLAAALAACTEVTYDEDADVRVELTASPTTARTGQSITFTLEAEGSVLDYIAVQYGDGGTDTIQTSNAQTAYGTFVHAYATVGTFRAVGSVWDVRQGVATDTVVIQITGG